MCYKKDLDPTWMAADGLSRLSAHTRKQSRRMASPGSEGGSSSTPLAAARKLDVANGRCRSCGHVHGMKPALAMEREHGQAGRRGYPSFIKKDMATGFEICSYVQSRC